MNNSERSNEILSYAFSYVSAFIFKKICSYTTNISPFLDKILLFFLKSFLFFIYSDLLEFIRVSIKLFVCYTDGFCWTALKRIH